MRTQSKNEPEFIDRYKIIEGSYKLISLARGLPADSIKPGDLTFEQLCEEADKLAASLQGIEWALVGYTGAILHEYREKLMPSQIRTVMKWAYQYPWKTATDGVNVFVRMIADGVVPNLGVPFSICRFLWNPRAANSLTREERLMLWEVVTSSRWRPHQIRAVVSNLFKSRSTHAEKTLIAQRLCIEIGRIRDEFEQRTVEAMVGVGDPGDGEGPEEDR